MPEPVAHPDRKEIARFLLSRGIEFRSLDDQGAAAAMPLAGFSFPDPVPAAAPLASEPSPDEPLPAAEVVVITWTADEARALARCFTPERDVDEWYDYAHRYAEHYEPQIRSGAPARQMKRLARYMPASVGARSVLCMKSELHLNQDGIEGKDAQGRGTGTATLPVKDFLAQVIEETGATHVLTIGTAGSVFDEFGLGDVVVTRAARFRCQQEFANEPFNDTTFRSDWEVPTTRFEDAERLMAQVAPDLAQPPVGPPSPAYPAGGELAEPAAVQAKVRLDGTPPMKPFWPILTTDFFEYGTTANRLDRQGSGVEMGDAALGLAVSELPEHSRPRWLVIRNMSDPVINGDLPAKEFHLNEQTTWAVAFYTAYGYYTSLNGAIATWAVIAGLPGHESAAGQAEATSSGAAGPPRA
jgi:hypothetical protein